MALSLVELAVIAPLIIMLGMGVLEFGLAWRDSLTISNTLRSGARVGSNSGDDRLADYNTLKQVEAAIEQIPNTRILRIVIFKSTTSNGAVPTACASGTSVTNVCNVYTAAQMDTLTEADFDQPDCDGDPDESWCPTTPPELPSARRRLPRGVRDGPAGLDHQRVPRHRSHHDRHHRDAPRAQVQRR